MLVVTEYNPHLVRGVCLVGFMGAGKTSVGQELARILGWCFTDLDDIIEAREKCSIAEIFRNAGERAFRQAEKEALRTVLSQPRAGPMVIALGGGAFVQPENAHALRQAGLCVVFLDAPLEELRRRCMLPGSERPLFADKDRFRQLYEGRRNNYMKADLRIETAGLTPAEAALEVTRRLGLEGA